MTTFKSNQNQNESRSSSQESRIGEQLKLFLLVTIGVATVFLSIFGIRMGWTELWLTPDQLGQRLYRKGQYTEAAKSFRDVNWQGVAWYRAGEFERAAQTLGNLDTPSAHFNTGNAWLMLGKYQVAADCYARAIAQQPNWLEAIENRDLALARAKLIERTGADLGDQQIGADKVVFDKDAKNEGQETEVEGTQPLPDAAIQELWLRRVQTRPADFLRSKFSHQQTLRQYSGESPE